ncbi:MAG TPA: CBS domain-containing protein [Nevskiales bacterium]|nr:CBS domain-containing protein [Nevskiales bacterium]
MTAISTKTVRDYMTTRLLTFTPDTEIMAAMRQLVTRGHSGAPVVDEDGHVVGMLSEKDCLKVAVLANYEGVSPGLVRDYMSPSVVSVTPDTSLLEVASRFVDAPFKRFAVVVDGKLVGQISRSDVLRAIDELS